MKTICKAQESIVGCFYVEKARYPSCTHLVNIVRSIPNPYAISIREIEYLSVYWREIDEHGSETEIREIIRNELLMMGVKTGHFPGFIIALITKYVLPLLCAHCRQTTGHHSPGITQ
jgi:hypothetical protein